MLQDPLGEHLHASGPDALQELFVLDASGHLAGDAEAYRNAFSGKKGQHLADVVVAGRGALAFLYGDHGVTQEIDAQLDALLVQERPGKPQGVPWLLIPVRGLGYQDEYLLHG